ncbi:phosphoesterase [Mycolicibacterium moriokaense]|nr:phosphoesterase [Mycolicibacterium moriokaense]
MPDALPVTLAALVAMRTTPVPHSTVTNGDEALNFGGAQYIGNFHKTLPRHANGTGEVDAAAYVAFAGICDTNGDYEYTPASPGASKLINPQAGRATEQIGPDPTAIHMLPAPSVVSDTTAAEMVELYWMAKVRDVKFNEYGSNTNVSKAITDIKKAYQRALNSPGHTTGDVRLGLDVPLNAAGTALHLTAQTVFRGGLPDEDKGPLVSQFLLQDFNYGAQLVKATQVPYKSGKNYLTNFADWLKAQGTGRDNDGHDYPGDNNYSDANGPSYYENKRRRIQTMRDLARFVNRDALHQAYFNAALQLGNLNAKADPGNPYGLYGRQIPFGTLGGPHLLALVSEVASRALHVVWRQKWTHRRLRPEAYGGLLHVQQIGVNGTKRPYGLPTWPFDGYLPDTKNVITGSDYFLPLAFTAGSPAHPSYGAGHATVAGACVTILKAWFDDTQTYKSLLQNAGASKDPSPYFPDTVGLEIWNPGTVDGNTDRCQAYKKADAKQMTVGGELNKLAANVAMGRSMGGVHWRTDNTRSLRLGEQISTIILSQLLPTLPEHPNLSYTNFDGNRVHIAADGTVTVPNDPALQAFYVGPF